MYVHILEFANTVRVWSTFCLILGFRSSFYSQNGISDQKYGAEIFVQEKRADNTKFDKNLTIQAVHRFEMLKKSDTRIIKYIETDGNLGM